MAPTNAARQRSGASAQDHAAFHAAGSGAVWAPEVCTSSSRSVTSFHESWMPGTRDPSTSPTVESQRSVPSATRSAASVAFMALVQLPRWKRSPGFTASFPSRTRTPAAPSVTTPSFVNTATASPGTLRARTISQSCA